MGEDSRARKPSSQEASPVRRRWILVYPNAGVSDCTGLVSRRYFVAWERAVDATYQARWKEVFFTVGQGAMVVVSQPNDRWASKVASGTTRASYYYVPSGVTCP